jgi:oxygen-dependent protoporphyrinogen oxidase
MKNKDIVIIGSGITGLATSYWLKKAGFNITILEAGDKAGGAMKTEIKDGFLIDFGPNSGLETTPLIRQIVEDIGLKDEMIYASEKGNNRYILKNEKLHSLPMGLLPFIKTKLFSTKGKLRLFAEPFIGKSEDGYYQSLGDFVKRRLGEEFLKYAIDPFVSGVFAGDPNKLSVKSAFPKLYRLEEVYGGLIKGMIKGAKERKKRAEQSKQSAKMFSFKSGMQIFPITLAKHFDLNILYNAEVKEVVKIGENYKIIYQTNNELKEIITSTVLATMPAYKLANVVNNFDTELSKKLQTIVYPPVIVLYLGYNLSDIKVKLDGFGFLIPSVENKKFLGAIWSSTIFVNRAPEDKASFTLFIGGARKLDILNQDIEKLVNDIIKEFNTIMGIYTEPVIRTYKIWEHAIPQYNIGYIEIERAIEKFESENLGFFISGNHRGGISVGDCIKNSEITANKIIDYINK